MASPALRNSLRPAPDSAGEPILPPLEGGLADTEIDLDTPPPNDAEGFGYQLTGDGGSIIDLSPTPPPAEGDNPEQHDANLAEFMDESDLNAIAQQVDEAIDDDKASRAEWEGDLARGMEQLGLKIEDRTYPFAGASGVFDPLMAKAVLRWQAIARGEMLPADGPVKTKIAGIANEPLEQQAQRVKDWMNLYFTELAPEYYEQFDAMLFWLPLVGSMFKKVYQDPVLARPVAPFLTPMNFIVSYTTTDMMTSTRATQISPLNYRQVKELQLLGVYRNVDIGKPENLSPTPDNSNLKVTTDSITGLSPIMYRTDTPYEIRESHVDLDLKGWQHQVDADTPSGLPLPYVLTYDHETKKVLALRRNWAENDDRYQKKPSFVHYKFMPGFGFYGYGYAHILGGSAKAATSLRRQLIDSGTLNNFPGGLRVKGMKFDDNNFGIGPTEFREVDTGGLPIQQAVMTMPYKEPSVVLLDMLKVVDDGADQLGSTQEIAVGEGRQDAPVGTTVALMEAANRVQSATLKRCHTSFRQELKMFSLLFGQHLPEEPYPFPVPGGQSAIMRSDFSDHIDIIPVSDPNITSSAQRTMRAELLYRQGKENPTITDQRALLVNLWTEMGIDEAKIMRMAPPPQQAQPMDPLTENQFMITGKPVAAGAYQDHQAHIAAHSPLIMPSAPGEAQNMVAQAAAAHIAEHTAMAMRVKVENVLGMPLPTPGQRLPPQVENQIAMLTARAMEIIKAENEGQNPSEQSVAMEALRIEAAKVMQKAAESKAKLGIEAYKANLKFQSDAADRSLRLRETHLNNRTTIATARMRPRPRSQ